MKKIIIILLSLAFLFVTANLAISKNKNYNYNRDYYKECPNNYQHGNQHYKNSWHPRHHSHNYRDRYYSGRRHHYKGHYRSWEQWERFKRRHPNRYRRGRYYYENNVHLMFKFCDPDTGGCFFFSIGR